MKEIWTDPLYIILAALLVLNFALGALNRRAIPLAWISYIGRLVRCAFFSLAIFIVFNFIFPDRPQEFILLSSLLAFFLMETVFYWLEISLFNATDFSQMRRYVPCDSAWRPEPELLKLKSEILARGFKKIGSFKSTCEEVDFAYTTVFEDGQSKTRLSVVFVPYGDIWRCMSSAESTLENGKIIYTEASQVPFGLEYPENYKTKRYPMISSPLSLLEKHFNRISKSTDKLLTYETDADAFLNGRYFEIEKYNRNIGYINQKSDEEEIGYLSAEGKYRLWKDMLRLSYFPFLMGK